MSRTITIALILLLAASSLIIVAPAQAEVPKPSAPQFTARYIPGPITFEISFDTIYESSQTRHSDLGAVEITITNQEYSYSNGSTFSLYYNVKTRNPAFGRYWTEQFGIVKLFPQGGPSNLFDYSNLRDYVWGFQNDYINRINPQSNLTSTIIYLPILTSEECNSAARGFLNSDTYTASSQIDIQVAAMLGVNSTYCYQTAFNDGIEVDYPAVAYVTSSDWSSKQTVTITSNTPNTSPTPFPSTATPTTNVTPTQPSSQTSAFGNLSWAVTALLVGLVFVVAVLAVGMVVLWRKVATNGAD